VIASNKIAVTAQMEVAEHKILRAANAITPA